MKSSFQLSGLFVSVLLFLAPIQSVRAAPYDVPQSVIDVIELENNANPSIQYPNTKLIDLESVDIPLELLKTDFAKYLEPEIRNALVYTKDGKSYYRWVFNPHDSVYQPQVIKWLNSKGVDATVQHYFKGLTTASASTYTIAPDGTIFSSKASTDLTPGGFRSDKKLLVKHMEIARGISDFIYEMEQKNPSEYIYFEHEVAGVGIVELDQAITIRRLGNLGKGTVDAYPYFAFGHERLKSLASKLGFSSPGAALYAAVDRVGRAMGEMLARFGMTPYAPHGQNFLYGSDGKVHVRDIQDLHLWTTLLQHTQEGRALVEKFGPRAHTDIEVKSLGIWDGAYQDFYDEKKVGAGFFKSFEEVFAKITGVLPEVLRAIPTTHPNTHYYRVFKPNVFNPSDCYFAQFASLYN